jgi:hypothetical protein
LPALSLGATVARMSNQPTKQPQYQLAFSSICPGDFGLKVGLWKSSDEMEFRDILGWVTVISKEVGSNAPPENGFHAVMLDDTSYPMVARGHKRYAAVFPKSATTEEAKALLREWTKPRDDGTMAQPNMRGVGKA